MILSLWLGAAALEPATQDATPMADFSRACLEGGGNPGTMEAAAFSSIPHILSLPEPVGLPWPLWTVITFYNPEPWNGAVNLLWATGPNGMFSTEPIGTFVVVSAAFTARLTLSVQGTTAATAYCVRRERAS